MIDQLQNFKESVGDEVFDDQFTNILSENPNEDLAEKWKDFLWTRLVDLKLESDPKIFADIIKPSDIKQGQLGDCYFMSSLSVLAKHPSFIREMFISGD